MKTKYAGHDLGRRRYGNSIFSSVEDINSEDAYVLEADVLADYDVLRRNFGSWKDAKVKKRGKFIIKEWFEAARKAYVELWWSFGKIQDHENWSDREKVIALMEQSKKMLFFGAAGLLKEMQQEVRNRP